MPDNLTVILLNEKEMEVENLFQLVKTNHGEYINEDELEKVRKDIEVTVELAEKLRAIKIDNSIEPFTIFKPIKKR
jgi:hypothetical protein